MPELNVPQTTLRDVLSAKLDAAEVSDTPAATIAPTDPPQETQAQREERARDDHGRFARADGTTAPTATPAPAATPAPTQEPQATQAPVQTTAPTQPPAARLTTWRKDFLPLQDKLAQGLPLTADEGKKLADYNVQREKEYATGVSTYKAEAQNAKELQDALTPFMPDLQANNIKPATWISNLGNAHLILVKGSPQQKLQMFAHLAQQYGIPLAGIAPPDGQQVPEVVTQLMAQIDSLKGQVNTVTSWREQQVQQSLQKEISKFEDAEKYPHFEAVRGDMAQLLESGVAKNLDDAYERAIYGNSETRQAEIARQAHEQAEQLAQARQAENNVAAANKAKARAVSSRTATPSGTAVNSGPKDRRASLSEQFDALASGRV